MSPSSRSILIDSLLVILTTMFIWNTYDAISQKRKILPETSRESADSELELFLAQHAELKSFIDEMRESTKGKAFPERGDFYSGLEKLKASLIQGGYSLSIYPTINDATVTDGTFSWSDSPNIKFEKR